MISGPIPFDLENTTLEAWIEIDPQEAVKDLALGAPIVANTNWQEDYTSYFAVDGDMSTYWSSQLGKEGDLETGIEV